LSFAVVLFASERIPAIGAPAAFVDLPHQTHEKAADTHTTASRIWYIFRLPLTKIPERTTYRATNAILLQLFRVIPMAYSAPHNYENSRGRSHSRDPITGKEDHGETKKCRNENELKTK
jgi:hypothetical protein